MTLNENDKNSVLKLTIRLNEIRKEKQELDMEENAIIYELWELIPSLKDDVNLELNPVMKKRR